jgi:hypothetical protein
MGDERGKQRWRALSSYSFIYFWNQLVDSSSLWDMVLFFGVFKNNFKALVNDSRPA